MVNSRGPGGRVPGGRLADPSRVPSSRNPTIRLPYACTCICGRPFVIPDLGFVFVVGGQGGGMVLLMPASSLRRVHPGRSLTSLSRRPSTQGYPRSGVNRSLVATFRPFGARSKPGRSMALGGTEACCLSPPDLYARSPPEGFPRGPVALSRTTSYLRPRLAFRRGPQLLR